jgi:hypothetical protein
VAAEPGRSAAPLPPGCAGRPLPTSWGEANGGCAAPLALSSAPVAQRPFACLPHRPRSDRSPVFRPGRAATVRLSSAPVAPATVRLALRSRESICVPRQAGSAGDQREFERTMALRMVRSLCMQATMATLRSLRGLIRSKNARITGL